MGLISKAFSDIITFSRASNATRIGPDGTVQYAPHNLLTYSQAFTNAAWGTKSGTFTANAAAAPDGTVTATKWVATDTDPYCYQSISLSAATHTLSVWIKAEGVAVGKTGTLRFGGSSTTVTLTSSWQRVSYTYATSATTYNVGFELPDNGAAAGDTVYIWGAQLSVGSIAGDYTPTTSAAVYGPRFDYDPVTLAAKGLLIEEQRTNLMTYSEDLSNAAWLKSNATVTANAVVAPDGTTTADKLVDAATTSVHSITQAISVTSGTAYTVTFYAKAAERSFLIIQLFGGSTFAYFNLATGVVGTTSGSPTATSVTPAGNGWYRCSITSTAGATGSVNCIIYAAATDGNATYTGDGTSGIYLWGGQYEAGAFATSYIPTVASTVTRSADVASVNTLSPWYNAVEGTMFMEFLTPAAQNTAGNNMNVLALSDGTTNNRIRFTLGGAANFEVAVSGTAQASLGTTWVANTTLKWAGAYKANDFAFVKGGGTPDTDASGTIPTVSQMQIGDLVSTRNMTGYVRRIAYFPRRLTNAELQSLTA